MRLTTYRAPGDMQERPGAVLREYVVDLAAAAKYARIDPPGSELASILAGGEETSTAVAHSLDAIAPLLANGTPDPGSIDGLAVRLADAELLPVIPRPGKFICIGRNYADHVAEASRPMPEVPVCFARFADSLIGHGARIVRPQRSHQLDWEGELAVVVGSHCRPSSRDEALSAIAGYSIFNDVTVRDYQQRGVQWTAGKNFYATGGFGPWLVTADEIPDPGQLGLEVRVNDEKVQEANTRDMLFDVVELLLHIAEWTPLRPGDVIATGTPAGVGFVREPPWFLRAGDVVEVEIERVGTLVNTVTDE